MVEDLPNRNPSGEIAFSEQKMRHLEMLQTIISRMASISANLKTFAVSLTVGALAILSQSATSDPSLLRVIAIPIALLAWMDAQYLARERGFRRRYSDVRTIGANHADFDLSPPPLTFFSIAGGLTSISIWPFYGALFATIFYAADLLRR